MELEDIITSKDISSFSEEEGPVKNPEPQEPEVEDLDDQQEGEQAEDQEPSEEPEGAEEEGEPEEEEEPKEEEPKEEEEPAVSYMEIAREALPDKEFTSESEAAEAVKSFVHAAKEYEATNTKYNKVLIEIFEQNPEALALVRMLKEGAKFHEALPYVVDPDTIVPKEGDPDYAAWQKAKIEGEKVRKEREERAGEVQKNLQSSYKAMDDFVAERKMGDKDREQFFNKIDDVIASLSKGVITKDILSVFEKGLSFEKAIDEQTKKAELKGRNEAIKEKVSKETKKKSPLPNLKGVGSKPVEKPPVDAASAKLFESIDGFSQDAGRF